MKLYRIATMFVILFFLSGCDQSLIDKENQEPVVTGTQYLELDLGSSEPVWQQYIEVTDEEDGVIRVTEDMIESFVNFDLEGVYDVNFYVFDSDGRTVKYTMQVEIIDNRNFDFSLLGDGMIYLHVNSEYTEPGVVSEFDDGNSFFYETSTDLDTNIVGEYTISYIFRKENIVITRTIIVEDKISPTFTFVEDNEVSLELNSEYAAPTLLINDNYYDNGFITYKEGEVDMDTVGTYTVNYFIDDPSGNSSLSKEYIVHVVDYSLINFNVVEINVDHANSNEYIDLGVDLVNELGNTIKVFSIDNIDINIIGIQVLSYLYTDSKGVEHETSINVNVLDVRPPTEIVILHGSVYDVDPFHENYSGTDQLERQELQRKIEEQYNVRIVYRNYSPSAAWGPSRISAIIQSSVTGEPLGDIYWITSDWIQQLVEGNALADVSGYLSTLGNNIPEGYNDIGEFQGGVYGFDSNTPVIDIGLYYNADLIDSLGVENPTDLYLAGNWTWTDFEIWATQVQLLLDAQTEEMYALGGMLSYYAEAMIPLNGGSLINKDTGIVGFAQDPALETYDFLTLLWEKGLYEPSGQYDAGSPLWMTGKVAMHPGSLWFVNADNRWGGLPFELGFVPYPVADDYTGEYISPIKRVELYSLTSGMDPDREALVFEVWNELQLWKTETEEQDAFELSLLTKFDDEKYIEAYLEVYNKTYLDIINAMGISAYSENGWNRNINVAIKDGSSRTVVDTIKPIYEACLDDYLGE